MAATDTSVLVTEGAGKAIATRTVDSQYRQKIVIGGAEDGESYLGLPLHNAIDSGAPLKIGGWASISLPAQVADSDRVNARFTREGALATVNTITAGKVWVDGLGLLSTATAYGSSALNNTATSAIGAAGVALKIYVTRASFIVTAFTTAGYVTLRDGASNDIFPIGVVTAVNTASVNNIAPDGNFLASTTANTALNIFCSGNATIKWSISYYVAS